MATSQFKYNIDIREGTAYTLQSTSEFVSLQSLLDTSKVSGNCELGLCNLTGTKGGPCGWKGPGPRCENNYSVEVIEARITIPGVSVVPAKLLEDLEQLPTVECSEIYMNSKISVNVNLIFNTHDVKRYYSLVPEGRDVLDILRKHGIEQDIYEFQNRYPQLFNKYEVKQAGPEPVLVKEKRKYTISNLSIINITIPNNAIVSAIPTLSKILAELKQSK